jgi:hypothetical protein
MPKTVQASKFQEWKGLDRISSVVHEMKCIFREISKDDFGIDGEIEIVISKVGGKGYETTGGILKVQAKSGASYVKQDNETKFITPVTREDVSGWLQLPYPILFIVYHPEDDRLYFKEIKTYFRQDKAALQSPLRIEFDKSTDEFNAHCHERLCRIAAVSPPRISRDQREKLYSNLLVVKRGPKLITSAPTDYKDYTEIRNEIRGYTPPFTVTSGMLYTLADLRDPRCVLREYCATQDINDVSAVEWAKSEERSGDYVFLLNQLLGSHLNRCGLVYNRDFKRNYFPRRDDVSEEFKDDWFNVRTGRMAPSRIVAKYYRYGILRFWRHLAVNLCFRKIGKAWFLQVLPKYFFTTDGETPCDSDLVGPYTTRIKAMERNNHVLNHVLFWTDVFSQRKPSIVLTLYHRAVMAIEKEPLSGIADFAIPDDLAVYEEEIQQPSFFSLIDINNEDEGENDEY